MPDTARLFPDCLWHMRFVHFELDESPRKKSRGGGGGGGGLGLLTRMPQEKSVVSSWSPSNPAISQVVIRGTSSQRAPSVVVLPNAERHIKLPQTGQ